VRRRSFVVERASVWVPPDDGASSDKCDLAPIVRLPNVSRGCGRSVSEPDWEVHGDVALKGVTGVSAPFGVARLRASRCCSPLSALTLTVRGRENVSVFDCRLLLTSDEEDSLDSVRETGGGGCGAGVTVCGVTAVVGAGLGVVMLNPGLELVLARTVVVEVVEIFRRFVDLSAAEADAC
jgi:hypothetical protein